MTTDLISRLAGTLPSDLNATTPVACVDYECFYTTDYSVKKLSYWHYCHHPLFRAYRVSIVSSTGIRWVGFPKDAPWDAIRNLCWLSHNRPFDLNVHAALVETGVVPDFAPPYWGDTMLLCAYLRLPRALAKAVYVLYKFVHDKDIRDKKMIGLQWEEYPPELQVKIDAYTLVDGELPLRIWKDFINEWPVQERRIADLISYRGLYGLYVDQDGLQADIDLLERVRFSAIQLIPWCMKEFEIPDTTSKKKKKKKPPAVASKPNLAIECRRLGIEPPPSLSKEDPGLAAWEDKYSEQYPFVRAMRDYNRAGAMLQKYKTIRDRIKPNGRFEFAVTYLGTSTGRTSGTDRAEARKGANMLNLPRDPMLIRDDLSLVYRKDEMKEAMGFLKKNKKLPEGVAHSVYLRSKIIPSPGHKFVIADKAQIEARIINWFARDTKTLDLIRSGISVYEAHARVFLGYESKNGVALKDDDPFTYALAKARELALGFNAGHIKFIEMAHLYVSEEEHLAIFNRPYTTEQAQAYEEYLMFTKQESLLRAFKKIDETARRARVHSWLQVSDYRRKKTTLTALWKKTDIELRRSAATGGMHVTVLPSWRSLKYFNIRLDGGSIVASTERGSEEDEYLYGGKGFQHAVQGTARDVFVEDQLRLTEAGVRVVLDIYDEVLTEVPINFDNKIVKDIMSTPPAWAKTLPVGASCEESYYYKK